jgi:hypothetical protein
VRDLQTSTPPWTREQVGRLRGHRGWFLDTPDASRADAPDPFGSPDLSITPRNPRCQTTYSGSSLQRSASPGEQTAPHSPTCAPADETAAREAAGCAYAQLSVIVGVAAIEAVPDNNTGQQAREVRELSVEAASYEEGVTELRSQLPEGWRIMNLRRDSY